MVVSFAATFVLYGVYEKRGKLDAAETGKAPEPLSAEAKKPVAAHADNEIVAMANGELIPASQIQDEAFAQEVLGQTIAIEPTDGVIASPANGAIELIHDTGHAFGVRMADGTELLIHIGIDTVRMKGKGFRTLKKEGDAVKAGEPVVEVDLDAVKAAGYSMQTMLIITETPGNGRIAYADFGPVNRGQTIASV